MFFVRKDAETRREKILCAFASLRTNYRENNMNKNEVYAAIALALHEYMGNNVHDIETGKITIAEHPTQWNQYSLSMTAHP